MKKSSEPILLILDLDETLIHASETVLSQPADFTVFGYHVYKRPYLEEFLRTCVRYFRLAIWSSASDDYVQEMVKRIIPAGIPLAFVWGRSRCTYCLNREAFETAEYVDYLRHYHYLKVLKKVKRRGYRLERVLMVDDTPAKARRNYGNVIYPGEYLGDPDDQELKWLTEYLLRLKDVENVRTVEKRNWRNERL